MLTREKAQAADRYCANLTKLELRGEVAGDSVDRYIVLIGFREPCNECRFERMRPIVSSRPSQFRQSRQVRFPPMHAPVHPKRRINCISAVLRLPMSWNWQPQADWRQESAVLGFCNCCTPLIKPMLRPCHSQSIIDNYVFVYHGHSLLANCTFFLLRHALGYNLNMKIPA
jgi:hypothetical protein